ncbi:TlpA family protein disulfide reductase [Flammeovirga sp. SubArs3]|uniref:TlpA family protein disulfide reductase n=1 Tax=Flammeovirga sp. SubArs3 TaxID=2995316 RepID=UPI00248CC16B|nr:TlpA family protein disulfide reductase [Flammeovirga sp. SubArs3]
MRLVYTTLSLIILLVSCTPKKGSIYYKSNSGKSITAVKYSPLNATEEKVSLDKVSEAEYNYSIDATSYLTIHDDNFDLEFLVSPGQSIEITKEDGDVVFKGDNAAYNQSLYEIQRTFDRVYENINYKDLSILDFNKTIKDLENEMTSKISENLKKHQKEVLLQIIQIETSFIRINYDLQTRRAREEEYVLDDKADIKNFDLSIIDELYQQNFNYLSYYIPHYSDVKYFNNVIYQKSGEFYYALRADEYKRSNLPNNIKEKLIASDVSRSITNYGFNHNSETLLYQFLQDFPEFSHKNDLIALIKKHSTIKNGNPAPEIKDTFTSNGKFFDINQYKGKLVYINVWATWCTQCESQLIDMNSLRNKYDHEKINFITLSVDRDQQMWKNYVENNDLEIDDNVWTSNVDKFYSGYKIFGLPRFILINQEGNIIDAFAPAPASTQLEELIAEAI